MELLPHYVVMIALMLVALTVANQIFGDIGLWPSIGIAVVIAILYPLLLRQTGRAPEPWQ